MSFDADHAILLDRLDDALRVAPKPTPELFSAIVASACIRIPVLGKAGKSGGIGRLVETGAWTDAALALIELELPAWKVRRLVYEGGEWMCSLSRQPNLPVTLDETADATHEILALAILLAFLQARRTTVNVREAVSAVPAVKPAPFGLVCCDNFA